MRTPSQAEPLLARLQARDEHALEELAEQHGAKIYQLALRYLRNKEDAEEVTQDVLHTVYRKAHTFRGDSAFSSWIYRITFNAAMSRLRTGRLERSAIDEGQSLSDHGEAGSSLEGESADWSNLADDQLLRLQLRRRVAAAIRELPAIYRAPVMLRDIQGLSTEEASAVLHVKNQTLKSRLHRGRMILREQLADFAGGLSLRHAFAS